MLPPVAVVSSCLQWLGDGLALKLGAQNVFWSSVTEGAQLLEPSPLPAKVCVGRNLESRTSWELNSSMPV